MLTAEEIMVKPKTVSARAGAEQALAALFASRHGVLLVKDEAGSPAGLITAVSALRALAERGKVEGLKAADLALPVKNPVSLATPWPEFLPELSLSGAVPVKGPDGKTVGAVTLDILALRLGVRASDLERELDAVINCSSDEILVADGEGTVLRTNALFEENFGVSVADVLGKNVSELEQKGVFFPSVTRLVLRKKSAQTVLQSRRDGRKLLATGTPAFNPDGSIFRVVTNTRDITRLNRLQQRLEEAERLKNRYYQELMELRRESSAGDEILACSAVMRGLLETARKIAAADSTVLLTGESGVGKGMVARYIHDCSPRCQKPFITVNCGAIPESLLESELFGYVPGAFTGAHPEGKIGKLELAHEGTLFLDEITELPLSLQVKLLHVIQEGVISRIGDTREIRLDLRIIAATNREIEKMVAAGRFREDLFFRLNVIPLEIPPLRRRPDDIEPLARHFLERFCRKYRRKKEFDPAVFPVLKEYRWPGNVRELENLVERMVIVADEELLAVSHLPRHILGVRGAAVRRETGTSPSPFSPSVFSWQGEVPPLKRAREALERELLQRARLCCRTTYEMAALLEVDQSTVVRKLKKYHIPPPDGELHQD